MTTLSLFTWIGNAAAVLCGRRGAVAGQARAAGCSRQIAYRHARRVRQAVADAQGRGPVRAVPEDEVQALRQENRQLWQALEEAIDFPKARQQRFAVTAVAMGLSSRQVAALLALLLGARAPRRASVGRWVLTSARRAGRLLAVLDGLCRTLVLTLCLDEIFCRRQPVLVAVEPHSLACLLARRTRACTGETWAEALQPWGALQEVITDAGMGLRKGLALYQEQRATPGQPPPPLSQRLDLFHTAQEAQRVLGQQWRSAESIWRRWDAKQRAFERLRWRGVHCQSPAVGRAARQAEKAQSKARKVLAQVEGQEQAWRRARAALELWRPDGSLNDRAYAAAAIAAALPALSGPCWAKVRGYLRDRRSLAFLDDLQQALAQAEPRAEARAALVRLWRLRQLQQQARGPAVALRLAVLVQQRVAGQLAADASASDRRVAAVLRRTVRASSAVEGMNSVWRMHQARHRGLSQALLDLKRLWWNSRAFAEGKRKGRCPYQLLGLHLPTYDPWELLQREPQELAQEVSTPKVAA
jgi:hypothetical protein